MDYNYSAWWRHYSADSEIQLQTVHGFIKLGLGIKPGGGKGVVMMEKWQHVRNMLYLLVLPFSLPHIAHNIVLIIAVAIMRRDRKQF